MYDIIWNGVNLTEEYDMQIIDGQLPVTQEAESWQLVDRSYAGQSKSTPVSLTLQAWVYGVSPADLQDHLDAIRGALQQRQDGQLTLGWLPDRYWLARFRNFTGRRRTQVAFEVALDFVCYDPIAYAIDETTVNLAIIADPATVVVMVGGTALVEPVLVLRNPTADATGIVVENLTTDEAITFHPTLIAGEELEIDCIYWGVTVDGVRNMAIDGQFPRLAPGENYIGVTNLYSVGNDGELSVTYRARYA